VSYIGVKPTIGNFQICDAISVVNGQAAYTMQVGSVNVSPESANHMLVSLNGILQKPGSSYTVSGSTITFASNLVTGDVIDFIQILGNVLDLGVPSDSTVTTAKIVDANVTLAKLSATGTKDSTTFLRGDNTFAEAGGGSFEKISTTTVSSGVSSVDFTTLSSDYRDFRFIISGLTIDDHQEQLGLRVKRSGQSSFDSSGYRYALQGFQDSNTTVTAFSNDGSASFINLVPSNLARVASVAFASSSYIVDIYNVHETTFRKMVRVNFTGIEGTYGGSQVGHGSGYRDVSDALIGLQFVMSAGNITGGTFTLYGRKI